MRSAHLISALCLGATLAFSAAGCEDAETADEQNVAETKSLFGDDRVADVLKGNLDKTPSTWAEFEKLFKIGRECARTDTKEIYVVEESSTRASGHLEETSQLLPRAVITGCNTGDGNVAGEPAYQSFSLMAALFSSPGMPDADKGDPIVFDRVEVMALDRKTGLYNFYVMTPSSDPAKPGILQRIQLRPDGNVYTYTRDPSKKRVSTKKSADKLCNNCHVNMGPLMNEQHEPWTNWVSTHKTLPESASQLSGETRSIVSEAVSLDGEHSRLSLANDLEKTMGAAIRVWNEGLPSAAGSGFIQANIDGDQPQAVSGMLKSVFCETELQYATSFGTAPIELFVDPGAVAGGAIQPPVAYAGVPFPVLMPVRSDMDKRIEIALIKKKVLQQRTVQAIRVFDDKNDVFSATRCGLYPLILEGLPADPYATDAHIRGLLRVQLDTLVPAGVQREFARTLLDDAASADAVKVARTAYVAEVNRWYAPETQKLQSVSGRDELRVRSQARKDAARAMFNRDANPMPLLHDEEFGL